MLLLSKDRERVLVLYIKRSFIMKKQLIILALAMLACLGVKTIHTQPEDVIGGGLLGAAVGGAFGGGRGAAIGAGVGALSGAAAGSQRRYYDYNDSYYNEPYPNYDLLEENRNYEPRLDRYPRYYREDFPDIYRYGPSWLDTNSDIYPNISEQPSGVPSTTKETIIINEVPTPETYPARVRPNMETSDDDIIDIEALDESTEVVRPVRNRRPFASATQEIVNPIVEATEDILEPVAEVTEAVARPVVQTTRNIVEPAVEATEDIVEPIAETTEDIIVEPAVETTRAVARPVARTTRNVVTPVVEATEDIIAAPFEALR